MLALFILALHNQTTFQMREPHGRCRLIHVLSTRAAGTEEIFAVFVRCDRHLHVLRFRQHGYRSRRCVDAALRFGVGHPLHAVASALKLQLAIHPFARHPQYEFLKSAQFGCTGIQHLDIPTLLNAIASVHLVNVPHEQCSLVAAGARAKLHDTPRAIGVLIVGTRIDQLIPLPLATVLQSR